MKQKEYYLRLGKNDKWYIYRKYNIWPLHLFLDANIGVLVADTFYIDCTKEANGCDTYATAHRIITEIYKGKMVHN